MLITRRVDFSASHICRLADRSDDDNYRLYGEAANPHGHGHNYVLEVSLEGEPDPVTGMIFDLKALKDVLEAEVIAPLDHRLLNREVPPFDQVVPTVENVALEIWRRLEPKLALPQAHLHSVRLYETEDLYVEIQR